MKGKLLLSSLLLLSSSVNATDNKLEESITTKEALEFANYINSKPTNVIIFETTTREINFEEKTALIKDVAKLNFYSTFKEKNYAETKPFTMDYSKTELDFDLNKDTYPEKRIQDKCNLRINEYGLFVEGKFEESGIFIVSGLRTKILDTSNIFYCYGNSESYSSNVKEKNKKTEHVKEEKKINLF